MLSYYTIISILIWMALCVLCILVRENDRIAKEEKRLFYITYVLIAVSALAEWLGVQLNGREELPKWPLMLAKCGDYILTPMAGGTLVRQMKGSPRRRVILSGILIANTAFQIVSLFTGWMVNIDEHNQYVHGPLYAVYIAVYLSVIVLIIVEFIAYGRTFRRQNRTSLYAIMILLIVGICFQEVLGNEYRTAYLSLTIGAALMFIHYTEYSQLAADDRIQRQRVQIATDSLTGVQSRHAYDKAVQELCSQEELPKDLAVFVIDINDLKSVNDTLGHEAGDELICGAARCVEKVLGSAGCCYRTGGDEFVLLAHMEKEQAEQLLAQLEAEAKSWSGRLVKELSLAVGYTLSAEYKDLSYEDLLQEADLAMYTKKAAYYRQTGKDRRSSRLYL